MRRLLSLILTAILCLGAASAQNYPELKPLSARQRQQISASHGVRPFSKKQLWGIQTLSGKTLVKPVFSSVTEFDKYGLARVCYNGKYGIIDQNCQWVLPPFFDAISKFEDTGVCRVCQRGKFGLINQSGRAVLKIDFDEIGPFVNGVAKVRKGADVGLISSKCELVLEPGYDDIQYFDKDRFILVKDGKKGLCDSNGEIIVSLDWDSIEYGRDKAFLLVGKEGHLGTLSLEGKMLCEAVLDKIEWNGKGFFISSRDFKKGTLSPKGEEILPAVYEMVEMHPSKEFLGCAQDGKYVTIATNGFLLINPSFDKIGQQVITSEKNLVEIAKDGLHGYILADGAKMWLEPLYDEVKCHDGEYFTVSKDGKWGVITSEGCQILSCCLDSEPDLSAGREILVNAEGRLAFLDNNRIEYMSDRDKRMYEADIVEYISTTSLPACAKKYLDQTQVQSALLDAKAFTDAFESEDEDELRATAKAILGTEEAPLFHDSEECCEEKVGNDIYTHTGISKAILPEGICMWVNDAIKKESAIIWQGKKLSSALIASTLSRGRYRKVYNYNYSSYWQSDTKLTPRFAFCSKDGATLYIVFDIDFLNKAAITPAQYGIAREFLPLQSQNGKYYRAAICLSSADLKIKGSQILASPSCDVILSGSEGFMCYEKRALVKYDAAAKAVAAFLSPDIEHQLFTETAERIIVYGSTKKQGYIGFDNPLCVVYNKADKKKYSYFTAEKNNSFILCIPREDGFLAFKNDGNYEYVKFRDIEPANGKKEAVLKCEWNEFMGIQVGGAGIWSETQHRWLLHPVYDWTEKDGGKCGDWVIYPESEGVIPVSYKGKWGLIDKNGKLIIQYLYDEMRPCVDGVVAVRKGAKWMSIKLK
ncbi:MAG: WG repeat-containing protein [Bacteroidales bacterium]|nr:WG repeat-containing protein [Bacteroidales bacterium]